MDKEQILHDVSLAYLLYANMTSDKIKSSPEDFYQDYENMLNDFKKIVDHYNP